MKIDTVKIKNFRGYSNETKIKFNNLTVFVGKNDIGKSTILEALDIFFNAKKAAAKLVKEDINIDMKAKGDLETTISVIFDGDFEKITLDATSLTSLQEEYLLNDEGKLEIIKKYNDASSEKVFLRCKHPVIDGVEDSLMLLKNSQLKKILEDNNIICSDKSNNVIIRKAIRTHFSNCKFKTIELPLDKEDMKNIWSKLQPYLPLYSLFKSDRSNDDTNSEVQDPLQTAVKEFLNKPTIKEKLEDIAKEVNQQLETVADRTLSKLKDMDKDIAESLHPVLPITDNLPWDKVFKSVSIAGDEGIPINKRGSGVRRLILLNFFRAEAERRKSEESFSDVIYAIEEPETSQHANNQRLLIDAFKDLSKNSNVQVILTTHSSQIVKSLDFANIRNITDDQECRVKEVKPSCLPYPSLNEVNYLAYDEVSVEYHNELYGNLQMEAMKEKSKNESLSKFENWLGEKGCKKSKQWIRIQKGEIKSPISCTLHTYIRNSIHHPENKENKSYTLGELRESVEELRSIINSLT